VDREFRVIAALGRQGPVAKAYALADDTAIGAALLRHVDGGGPRVLGPDASNRPRGARADFQQRSDARKTGYDPQASSPWRLRQAGNYFARQVDR
jgi:hypothetical protein